jgi:DNA-binding transcriptional MerR regulator
MSRQLDIFGNETPPDPKPAATPAQRGTGRLMPPTVIHAEEAPEVVSQTPRSPDDRKETTQQAPHTARKGTRGRKSLKEMSLEAARVEIPEDEVLFSKQYYGIGEVAAMFQVNASLLRYWESEFDMLKLRKNRKGDRFFRPEDIKNLKLIHHLLRERKYTIEGAKDFLKRSNRSRETFEAVESLKRIRSFLLGLKAGL